MTRVLIVDDEGGVRHVLRRWLEAPDREIREAESAEVAVEKMAAEAADVVFCDIQMPGHDGLWLTADLRKRYRSTAIILATSVSSVSPRVSMQSGVLAYVVKPFTRDAILQAYDTALNWHRDVVAKGPDPKDTPDVLQAWLDAL